jgi:energy-coupling factor transport system permease protein
MSGVLSRVSPVGHLAVVALWILPVVMSFDPWTPLLFLGLCVLYLFVLGHVSLRRFVAVVMPLMLLPAGLFALNLLFTDTAGHPATTRILGVGVNDYALYRALVICLRSAALITISVGYLLVTDPLELVNALMQQTNLSARFGFSIFVAWNTIPRFVSDYRRIRTTHRIRYRGQSRNLRDLVPTAVALLAGAIRHAERAAISMGVRGIESAHRRSYLRAAEWSRRDTHYVALNLLVVIGLFAVTVLNGWFVFGLG